MSSKEPCDTFEMVVTGFSESLLWTKSKHHSSSRLNGVNGLLTVDQAAVDLNVSPGTVRNYIKDGSLRFINVARKGSTRPRIRLDIADLAEFKQKHRAQEVPQCPSIVTKARRSTTMVLDFAALRAARAAEKRKRQNALKEKKRGRC
jgi:excisionase family DNA binding protein